MSLTSLWFFFYSIFLFVEKSKDDNESPGVGELEDTPVAAAIARYMGIDLSPEGQAARNRRGVAIIVHGSPHSGEKSLKYKRKYPPFDIKKKIEQSGGG